ncbi:histidine N-acetyltransferase-like [Pseudophryne corroboree]|uniref:histidine N-acetyltransferase-like n=1 Tax=Pseudophryne corroboree TaxID=495146 RepID=UPI003081FB95
MSEGITILPATAEDYEELMAISVGIYNGTDYLPCSYHEWLEDPQRRMFVAKCEGKVVGFQTFLLVDGGVTAVMEGLRIAPWMRGQRVAGIIKRFAIDIVRSDHPEVKTIRLTCAENPPPSLLNTYTLISSKAVISVHLPFGQFEGSLKMLESRVGKVDSSNNHSVLEPTEVFKLFEGTKIEELLPGKRLIQDWLPLTTHRANLELLLERRIFWIYSHQSNFLSSPNNTNSDPNSCQPSEISESTPSSDFPAMTQSLPAPVLSSINYSSPVFLSLGSPPYPVPLAEGMHVLEIDLFGNDPACSKIHVLQQLQKGIQALPAKCDLIFVMYAEENLRAELNDLCEGLIPFHRMKKQLLLEMNL